ATAAMTLPYLASWGPVLLVVAGLAAIAAGGAAIVSWRAGADPDAEQRFREYATSSQARLLATAYLLSGDPAEADRLVRQVLARVFLAWRRLPDPAAADRYARRLLVHGGRGRGPTWPGGDDLADRLYELPARQRAALVLRYHDGLTPAEV